MLCRAQSHRQRCMHWSCMGTNSTACIGAAWKQTALHALGLHGDKQRCMHWGCMETQRLQGCTGAAQSRAANQAEAHGRSSEGEHCSRQTDRQRDGWTQLYPVAVLQPLLLSSCGAAEAVGAKCDQNWGFCPQNGSWAALIWSQPGAGGAGLHRAAPKQDLDLQRSSCAQQRPFLPNQPMVL